MIWSVYDSPRIKGAISGPGVPKWLKLLQYWASDTLFVRPLVGGELNGFRHELGLPPVKRVFGQFMHQGDMSLGMFPDWFGPPQPDWPKNIVGRQVGSGARYPSPWIFCQSRQPIVIWYGERGVLFAGQNCLCWKGIWAGSPFLAMSYETRF